MMNKLSRLFKKIFIVALFIAALTMFFPAAVSAADDGGEVGVDIEFTELELELELDLEIALELEDEDFFEDNLALEPGGSDLAVLDQPGFELDLDLLFDATDNPAQTDPPIDYPADPVMDQVLDNPAEADALDLETEALDPEETEAAPPASDGGNSYKAEVVVDGAGTTAGMNQDVELTFTFTELNELGELLGSARIYLNDDFDYPDYIHDTDTGLTVNSYQGDGPASGWTALWETINGYLTVALRAVAEGPTGEDNYLRENDWVSVTFNATTPVLSVDPVTSQHLVTEYEFQTAAWTDNTALDNDPVTPTNQNNPHASHSEPQIEIIPLIGDNILTSIYLYEIIDWDDDDQPIFNDPPDLPDPMPNPYEALLALQVYYDFLLAAGHPYRGGSYYEFFLPNVFEVFNEVDGNLVGTFGPNPEDTVVFGTFELGMDGRVTLTFNDQIADRETPGWVAFNTRLVRENLSNDLEQVVVVDIIETANNTIMLNFEPLSQDAIVKYGLGNRPYNTEVITWTVDFNLELNEIENAVLQDPIGANLELDSIALYELIVNLDGTVEQGDIVDLSLFEIQPIDGGAHDGDDFQLVFNDTINSAYRLVFETTITDGDDDNPSPTYTNTATLTGTDFDPITADAEVAVQRGVPLAKSATGYDEETQTVTWEILVNYNKKDLDQDGSVITDTFGPNQELTYVMAGDPLAPVYSVRVYLVDIDDDTGEILDQSLLNLNTDYELGPLNGTYTEGFTVTFIGGTDQAHRIVYETTAIERIFGEPIGDGQIYFSNRVDFDNRFVVAEQDINQVILDKSFSSVNYAEKTMTWTIEVNRDSYDMESLVIVDTFTNGGLTILNPDDPFTITGLPADIRFTFTLNPTGNGFTINFVDDASGDPATISVPITITYSTRFDYELIRPDAGFINEATANWGPVPLDPVTITDDSTFTPNRFTRDNGFKRGVYNAETKEITWTIGVNYNLQDIDNATVFDQITGQQTLIPDSIAVYQPSIPPGGGRPTASGDDLVHSDSYTIAFVSDADGNIESFTVSLGNIDSFYLIEYSTSLDGLTQDTFTNTADLNGDHPNAPFNLVSNNVNVPFQAIYIDKSNSYISGRIIEWEVVINPGQSTISNVVVTDELNPDGSSIFLESSFVLYSTNVAPNGSITRSDSLARDEDYTLDVHVDGTSFILAFIGAYEAIESAFILDYQSYVLAGSGTQVSNNVTLTADGGIAGQLVDDEEVGIMITAGAGGIYNYDLDELATLIIYKESVVDDSYEDRTLHDIPLEGAQFELYYRLDSDPDQLFLIATGVTDASGILEFASLGGGEYVLREVEPPSGYVARVIDTVVFISVETVDDNYNKAITVLNDLIIRDVRLLKTDSVDDRFITGAEFELIRLADGTVIGRFMTDANGEIYVADLEAGNYQFVETQPANYYRLDSTPINFIIEAEQITVTPVSTENDFISVVLTKTDSFDQSIVLEGTKFQLEDDDRNILIAELTTDVNGIIEITALQPGFYWLTEIEAPAHYQLDQPPIRFEIVAMPDEPLEMMAANSLIPGSIELTKVSNITGNPLAGAVFRLIYQNGAVIHDNLVTDADGRLLINDLRPGNYRLVEIQAPQGYYLQQNRATTAVALELADLDGTGDLQQVVIANTRLLKLFWRSQFPLPWELYDQLFASMPLSGNPQPDPEESAVAARRELPQTGGGSGIALAMVLALIILALGMALRIHGLRPAISGSRQQPL